MGLFGESAKNRLMRYVAMMEEVVSEHDRTYHNQVKKIHEDYNTISPEEFDRNIKLEEFNISSVGLFKYRFLGACIIVMKFMKKKGDHEGFLQVATGMCNKENLDDEDSGALMDNKTLTTLYDSIVLDYLKHLSEQNMFEISNLHLDALGESVGKEFISSSINQNALRIQSLAVAEGVNNLMRTDLK